MKSGIKQLLYQLQWLFIPYLVVLIACFLIKLNFTREEIYFTVNGLCTPWGDFVAPFFTDLGDGLTVIALSLVLALFSYHKAFLLASSYAITSLIAQLVKHLFDAPRPKLYFKAELTRIHFVKGVDIVSLHSFPSGHTVSAFSAAVVLTYLLKNKKWGMVMLLIAMLVGYSRMYLSQHFFEDVLAGSIIGFFVTAIWLCYIEEKRFLHTPVWNRGLLKLR